MSQPFSIKDVLPGVLSSLGIKKGIERQKAIFVWDKVVGRDIRRHTKPRYVRGKKIWVDVDDPIWIQQLSFLKSKILKKLNTELGEEHIVDIIFKLKSGG
jgi:predicted nucleic acid-binding Zn ribbon protein